MDSKTENATILSVVLSLISLLVAKSGSKSQLIPRTLKNVNCSSKESNSG